MDKEKLNEAAEEYNRRLGKSRNVTWNDGEYGFIAGADWLMQQPLSERLTEEEKEKHRLTYERLISMQKEAFKDKEYFTVNIVAAQLGTFTQIFGEDFFKEK